MAAASFYRGHTPASTWTPWRSWVVWLPPWGEGTAPASELSGASCYFMAGDVITIGIYEAQGPRALKSEAPQRAQGHSTNKWPGSPSGSCFCREGPA